MKPYFICIAILFALGSLIPLNIRAQDNSTFPVPTGNPKQLFYLQRTQNTNTVVYELNIKNGLLDTVAPIHIFWICYAEKSQIEELTAVQRKYAYGITAKYQEKDHYQLRFAADKNTVMNLVKGPDHQLHVYEQINGKEAILTSIYLEIHGGSLFAPHVEYLLIKGIDPDSHAEVTEKRMPIKK